MPLSSAGETVRVAAPSEVSDCQRLGRATSKTTARVLGISRGERKVREELESLARNEAAELGGNVVVPVEEPAEGRQAFEVYRCEER